MKRLLIALLCVAMALSLAACGGQQDGQDPDKGSENQDTVSGGAEDKTPEGEDKTPEDPAPEDSTPEDSTPEGSDPEGSDPEGDTPTPPPFAGFGGIGGIGGGSGEQEDIPVTDAGDLVDQLDALCQGVIEGSFTASLRSSGEFGNYFNGDVQYTEGMRVAMNHLEMAPPAHVVMLIEVPAGEDAEAYAKNLSDNANPRWMICATANSVQYAVKDDLVLFVMSSEEIANAVIAAFNG